MSSALRIPPGFWTAIAVSSGTSDVVVTDQHGQTATLTLTVVDGKQGASIPESGASQADAARQEIVRLVNQVRRENGVPELTVNAALMDAAQHCASLRVTYHQNKVECEAVAASGYPHGFGSNITAFTNGARIRDRGAGSGELAEFSRPLPDDDKP